MVLARAHLRGRGKQRALFRPQDVTCLVQAKGLTQATSGCLVVVELSTTSVQD
jgi:hypothetical protein